jgi:hypothetical protein
MHIRSAVGNAYLYSPSAQPKPKDSIFGFLGDASSYASLWQRDNWFLLAN